MEACDVRTAQLEVKFDGLKRTDGVQLRGLDLSPATGGQIGPG